MADRGIIEAVVASTRNALLDLTKKRAYSPMGTRIYAYRHKQTNQVIYSLTRSLDNRSAMKQLIFTGKTSRPSALRKDHWKPFFTVKFGTPKQGLRAMKKLREWRLLHEYAWDRKEAEPFLEEKREEYRKKIEEDPDNHDDKDPKIRRRLWLKRFMVARSQYIQNQRANSVADLAAVLVEQEAMAGVYEEKVRKAAPALLKTLPGWLYDSTLRNRELKRLNAQRNKLAIALAAAMKPPTSRKEKKDPTAEHQLRSRYTEKKEEIQRLVGLKRWVVTAYERKLTSMADDIFLTLSPQQRIRILHRRALATLLATLSDGQQEMLLSSPELVRAILEPPVDESAGNGDIVDESEKNGDIVDEFDATTTDDPVEDAATAADPQIATAAEDDAFSRDNLEPEAQQLQEQAQGAEVEHQELISSLLQRESEESAELLAETSEPHSHVFTIETAHSSQQVRRTWQHVVEEMLPEIRVYMQSRDDVYRVSDIEIEWADMLDAEYGQLWPAEVKHSPMGIVKRHTSPVSGKNQQELADEFEYGSDRQLVSNPDYWIANMRTGKPSSIIGRLRQIDQARQVERPQEEEVVNDGSAYPVTLPDGPSPPQQLNA